MQFEQIHSAYKNPEILLNSEKEVDNWVTLYPQVAIFRSLQAKLLQLKNSPEYRSALKKAAIFSSNRKGLYEFIIQPELQQQIKKVDTEILTEPSESITTSELVTKELDSEEQPQNSGSTKNQDQEILEREILQHAISSSILLEADQTKKSVTDEPEKEEHKESEGVKKEESSSALPDNFDQLGLMDWLKLDSEPHLSEIESVSPKPASDLIASFIKKDPQTIESPQKEPTIIKIDRPKREFFSPENMAKMSLMEDEDLVTETLAKIYASQGNLSKAKKAYEKLSLKFPEKSNYFARLINELGNKH